jgi:hypothetical protein
MQGQTSLRDILGEFPALFLEQNELVNRQADAPTRAEANYY